ncbi:hypothetical protein DFR67_11633 [Williamsia limnetica]|uniref:Uncharacterized protein n=1 Tax=Williamsia limnetica TaxID=882452 RepID=A0A318RV89_WILLI|nr:hypothetical protein [Williamsia limnetica]PYE13479.1 hypothetical protein DFR67_11633 [Williamsia limnetica]
MRSESNPLVRRVGLRLAAIAVGVSMLSGIAVADVAAAPSPPAGMVNPKPAPPKPAPIQAKPKQQAPPAPPQQAPAPKPKSAQPAPPKQRKPIATPDRGPNKSEPKTKAQPASPPTKKRNKNRDKPDKISPATALDQTQTPSTPSPSATTTTPKTTAPKTPAPKTQAPKTTTPAPRTTVQPGPGVPEPPTSITGRTKHGDAQVTGRDGGRGVNDQAIEDAFNSGNPSIERDELGRWSFKYVGPNATIVLNPAGEIVTAIATNRGGWRNAPPPPPSTTSPPPVVTVPQAPTMPPLPTLPPLPEIKVPTVPLGTCGQLGGYLLCMPPDPNGPATA